MRKCAATLAITFCILSQSATAQTTPATVPDAMPFDIPYGSPIDLATAQKAIAAASAEAQKRNWKMSISVVGPGGDLIAHSTMDGTQYGSIAISQAKARTAAQFRRPSKSFADGVNGGSQALLSLLALVDGVASEGGFPITVEGKIVGAIGVSGGLAAQDAIAAKAGMDAVSR